MNGYERWWSDKCLRLSDRQKLFFRLFLKYGKEKARRVVGFDNPYACRVLNHPYAERYMLSLIGEAFDQAQVTLSQLLQDKYKLTKAKDIKPELKNKILDELIELASRAGEEEQAKLPPARMLLTKSKEITDAEYEEKATG